MNGLPKAVVDLAHGRPRVDVPALVQHAGEYDAHLGAVLAPLLQETLDEVAVRSPWSESEKRFVPTTHRPHGRETFPGVLFDFQRFGVERGGLLDAVIDQIQLPGDHLTTGALRNWILWLTCENRDDSQRAQAVEILSKVSGHTPAEARTLSELLAGVTALRAMTDKTRYGYITSFRHLLTRTYLAIGAEAPRFPRGAMKALVTTTRGMLSDAPDPGAINPEFRSTIVNVAQGPPQRARQSAIGHVEDRLLRVKAACDQDIEGFLRWRAWTEAAEALRNLLSHWYVPRWVQFAIELRIQAETAFNRHTVRNLTASGISISNATIELQALKGKTEELQTAEIEVTGEDDRPWGVYAGCVSRSDPFVEAYEIDMYIEKTWRDWRKMPANRITADVVSVLERLRVAMPGPAMRVSDDVSERRKNKLFVFPTQTHDRNAELAEYRFSKHSDTLFKEAKVDPKWRRTHQFRRLFALLYMYRHDHPSLQALSEMLCHLDIECTRTYVTDASMVAEAERIAVLYRCQDEAPLEELAEARREYAEEQIRAMLTSAEAGGTLTRRVRRWVKALVSKVEFDADDLERALAAVRTKMDKRGYSPESYPHGICWASHRHASRASCGRGGDLAREHAGIDVCSKCPFHSTSVAFLENVERDLRQLREAEDAAACSAEAATVRQEIVALEGLLAMERRLMERERRQDSDRAVLEEPA